MKKLALLFFIFFMFTCISAFAATQVSINNLPPPPSGSTYLTLDDKVPATQ